MAQGTQHISAGLVPTDASLSSMKHLTSVPQAALVLSLIFASFHLACSAEASSSNNSTLTAHHPDLETLEQCLSSQSLAQVALMTHPQDSNQRCPEFWRNLQVERL
ncbi:transmembrane protein 213 isoform X3 [Equus przewalskii]|uniref:Transmembrane protein 213 isoform X3 n=1 Tax=Equus przewalskii TaxID=9798 RepID=A0ABM2FHD5_EQUPR|nr:PREDICTED: transmembrane protein 213 isoform X2 [Equus przewalskii]XP_014594774.1 transmembrane protein 213 isoform X1 [Equus caballus]